MKRPRPAGSLGRLVREVAHDFNNLLTALIATADAALERSGIDPETRADIAHMREGARRGGALIRRLLPGAPDPCEPEPVSINQTIRATSRLLAHRLGTKISLTLDLTEPDNQVLVEPSQLDRALLNLIVNAGHAMRDGGTVTLRTERRVLAAADPRVPDTIPAGDYVVIAVADTGSGIPPEQLPRIFHPGFSGRRRSGGSGLGLASVRDIVRGCDGFIAVTSTEGRGTCFEIHLPRRQDAVPRCQVLTPRSDAMRTVLLVEDDLLVRRVAERILLRAGWHVLCADSAEAALAVLENARCDLMISDVAMPGMDGAALARLMQARLPDFPVILTSGYEPIAADDRLATARVAFLPKPYGQADLLDAVARIVSEPVAHEPGHAAGGEFTPLLASPASR